MTRLWHVSTRVRAPLQRCVDIDVRYRRSKALPSKEMRFLLLRRSSTLLGKTDVGAVATCVPARMIATSPKVKADDSITRECKADIGLPIAESRSSWAISVMSPLSPSCSSRVGTSGSLKTATENKNKEVLVTSFVQGNTEYQWDVVPGTESVSVPSVRHRDKAAVRRVLLYGMPRGFPETTAAGFQRFFCLSLASAFVSNFASSIGYQSLLGGFFLGSSPQLWMMKDLIPALFAAYMANRVVSYENRPKFWFVVSILMSNVTVVSDMLIPSAFPNHLLAATLVTSTLKQSATLMYFVARASALQHFAISNNLAELTKKMNSFTLISYTAATALGIFYCTYIASFTVQLITVAMCCVVNLFLSSMSMVPITFRLLNFDNMSLLLYTFIMKNRRIMTPKEVSDLFGVRMSPIAALKKAGITLDAAVQLVYVSPPLHKLFIRSDSLERDVFYVSQDHAFMLGMWKLSSQPLSLRERWKRYECSALLDLFRCSGRDSSSKEISDMRERFHGRRLVLLVQQKCSAQQLITAYLIMYTAVLQHADTEAELHRFLRSCHDEQELWRMRGEEFVKLLRAADWNVKVPSLDHHDFRLSELILPSSMRGAVKGGGV